MPQTLVHISDYDNIRDIRKKIFEKIPGRVHLLTKALRKIQNIEDYLETRDVVINLALNEALNYIKNKAVLENILIYSFIDACYQTKEYNYDLYIDRLVSAIKSNSDNMVYVVNARTNKQRNDVNIEFRISPEALGTVDQWAAAVEEARDVLNIGKVAERNMTKASIMWMEKIYKTGREGGQVFRTKKRKTSEGKEEYKENVTARYVRKYRDTVALRLSFIPHDKAPFWELIAYGNTNVDIGNGGDPYPNFGPTDLLLTIKLSLEHAFDMAFTTYRVKAEKYLIKLLTDSLSETSEELARTIITMRDTNDYYENRAYEMLLGEMSIPEERSRIIESVITDVEEITFQIKGRSVTRLRDIKTKRFL